MSLVALRRGGGEAIYRQIAHLLREEVSASLSPGGCLPSEAALAERFGVNRHTLRRAVDELVAAGLLERRHGSGTYVLDGPADYVIGSATRFTEQIEALGKMASSRVLRKLVIAARGGVAERLRLSNGQQVVWIETLRLADQRPVCVTSHFLPCANFPDLADEYDGGSLHAYLESKGEYRLRRVESVVSAVLPQGDDASLLGIPQNQPVLRIKSVNVCARAGTPLEYALTRFRADRIQLRINP